MFISELELNLEKELSPAHGEAVRLIRSSAVVSRDVAEETIVVPIRRGVGDLDFVYTFNSVGQQLWRRLQTSQSPQDLASWVAANFSVNAEQALADVQDFLSELLEVGLIHTA